MGIRVQTDRREERGAEGDPHSVFFPSTFGKATLTGRDEKSRGILLCSALMFLPKIHCLSSYSVLLSVAPVKQNWWQEKKNIESGALQVAFKQRQ